MRSSCANSRRGRLVGDLGDRKFLNEFTSSIAFPLFVEASEKFLDLDDARDFPAFELTEPDLEAEVPGTGGISSAVSLNLFASSRTEVCRL